MKFLSSLLLSLFLLLGSSALRAQDAPAVDNPEPEQLAEIFPSLYSPVISDLRVLSNPRERITKLDYNVAHPGHLYAYVETEAMPGEPPQNVGAWHTVAGLYKGFTPVAIKVDSSGDLVTGADPGGAVTSCTACIVVGGLNGLTPVALNVGSDGTVITSGGGGGGTIAIPATVSGATSGGIPCFDSATDMNTTVALTVNVLPKGGGAGACPRNSSITDNGTTVSTSEFLSTGSVITIGNQVQIEGSSSEFFALNNTGGVVVPIGVGSVNLSDDSLVSGSFHSASAYAPFACETNFGITTLSTGGATTNTGLNCLPANAIILGVVYRITTTITTATSFTIGDSSTAARFCSTQSTMTSGTTGVCMVPWTSATAGTMGQVAAASVRVTLNGTPGAGAMRIIVYGITLTPPTS